MEVDYPCFQGLYTYIYIYDLYIYRERILTLKNGKTKNKHILVKSRHTLRRVALNTDMSSVTWRGGRGSGGVQRAVSIARPATIHEHGAHLLEA